MNVIDLFAGLGGWSTGARMAGAKVLWAANHWPVAVEWHAKNHPDTVHVCQDLQQADWSKAPAHDVMLASPCCQGHSRARGKKNGNPEHDASRSTAFAVVSAAEFHRPPVVLVENVVEFTQWILYPAWCQAMRALGYQLAPHVVDCADLGVPQNRVRLFIVCTLSKAPLMLNLIPEKHVPALSFIDFEAGEWSPVAEKVERTQERVRNGRKAFGERFVFSYYGNTRSGRCLSRPIGTITTKDRWAIVDGDNMRMLSARENLAAMSFPESTIVPANHSHTVQLAGNAVPPVAAKRIIEAVMEAA